MKSLKINIIVMLVKSFIIIYSVCGFAYAASAIPACATGVSSTSKFFTGTYTVYLARDGSDPVPFGEQYIDLAGSINVDCPPDTFSTASTYSGGPATSSEGKTVFVQSDFSSNSVFSASSQNFGYEFGYTSNGQPIVWIDDIGVHLPTVLNNLQFHLMVTSLSTTVPREATLTSNMHVPVGTYRIGDGNSGLDIYANVTIKTILTSCKVTSSNNVNITWPSLTPTIIDDKEADIKTAPVSINCGGIQTPVKLTLTSSGGEYDASTGLIKTGLDNLGIQITLARNGNKLPFNQPLSDSLLGDKSYDLNAQLVHVGSGLIPAGDFSTTVTMAFEYR